MQAFMSENNGNTSWSATLNIKCPQTETSLVRHSIVMAAPLNTM